MLENQIFLPMVPHCPRTEGRGWRYTLRPPHPARGEGGGGGVVLRYLSHIDICRPRGYGLFCGPFWSEMGIHFAHFGLESGMVFEGITGVYERIYRFNSK